MRVAWKPDSEKGEGWDGREACEGRVFQGVVEEVDSLNRGEPTPDRGQDRVAQWGVRGAGGPAQSL